VFSPCFESFWNLIFFILLLLYIIMQLNQYIYIIIALFVIYFIYVKVQDTIVSKMETFMKENNIIEGQDIIFKGDKRKLLLDIYVNGNLALGDAYISGLWDSKDLFVLLTKILECKEYDQKDFGQNVLKTIMKPFVSNQTTADELINKHYNLGNQFFASWLDQNMQYSCAYWTKPDLTLDEAQIQKMNLIGRKLKLKPGMTVLDIGCGFGGLANYLSQNFDVKVTGINLSVNHLNYARKKFIKNPNVTFIHGDFCDILKTKKKFDRIVSVGFYEHVGLDRYDEFYKVMSQSLKDDGLCLLHTIGTDNKNKGTDEWINKHIFTRGRLPTICDISWHAQDHEFIIQDWHNFGLDYYKTLTEWFERFEKKYQSSKNKELFRMFKYYLLSCAASFYTQRIHLWQVVFLKRGHKMRYTGDR
jgi:cyclopropane-fatty-acyl-phospholipid synthase